MTLPCTFVVNIPFQAWERFRLCIVNSNAPLQSHIIARFFYKCFTVMRRTWLCWHHCLFSGNDRLRNRDSCVAERVAERLLRSSYLLHFITWYPSFIKMRVKHDLSSLSKVRFAFVISHRCREHNSSGFRAFFPRQLSATNRAFVEG